MSAPERQRRGLSLVELLVASALLSVVIPLVLNLLPQGLRLLRRSEQLQTATTLAVYRLDQTRLVGPRAPRAGEREVVRVGTVDYQVTRDIQVVVAKTVDVRVVASAPDIEPVVMWTRLPQAAAP